MNNDGVVWKSSIFTRLLLTFLLILLLIYVFAISFYKWGEYTVRNELLNSMKSQVSFFLNGIQNEVYNIKRLQYDFINDDDLNRLANAPDLVSDLDKMMAILRLQKHLNTVKSSSMYIQDVCLYIPSINRMISAKGGSKQTIDEIQKDEFNKLRVIPDDSDSQIIYWDNRLLLSVIYPFPDFKSDQDPSFIIEIELSGNSIRKSLDDLFGQDGNGYLLFNPGNKAVLAGNSEAEVILSIEDYINQEINKGKDGIGFIEINKKSYLVTYDTSKYLNMILVRFITEDQVVKPLKKYQIWFWIFTFVVFLIVILYSFSTYRFIHKPLLRLIRYFRKVENGDFSVSIEHKHKDEFRYLYIGFNAMVDNLNKLIDQVYKQKIHAQRAELKQLQSQISPHFLYNSFFILNSMSRIGDYVNLEIFTEQLGEYFQFITRSAADEVPLFKEVNHARVYTEIQAMRFSNRIKVKFDDLPEEYGHIMVPRLIIQPIIENAFEHGLEKMMENGILSVCFKKVASNLHITIDDNGGGLTDTDLKILTDSLVNEGNGLETTGIINIHRRLQIKFGPSSGLSFIKNESGGLKVIISISILKEDLNVQAANS